MSGPAFTVDFNLSSDVANYCVANEERALHSSRKYTPYNWFSHVARRIPNRVALVRPDGRLTYGELDDMARAFARGLICRGSRLARRLQ